MACIQYLHLERQLFSAAISRERDAVAARSEMRFIRTSLRAAGHARNAVRRSAISHSPNYKHSEPYQGYACKIQGAALAQVKYNFENAWAAALEQPLPFEMPPAPPAKILTVEGSSAQLVQIVRTQPRELDKSIKEIYFQASNCAQNYIYIENQCFF